MRNMSGLCRAALLATYLVAVAGPAHALQQKGLALEDLTWKEAEGVLGPQTVVVIPLGAASKEHGPHLRLDNDYRMAEYFTDRVISEADVVVAPTLNYHFYPAFLEYPGSTHLSFETARDLVVDIVRSLANYGPRRFYVLNTGVSTVGPLEASAEVLAGEGILLRYTDVLEAGEEEVRQVEEQVRGTHADEIETSMMLYIDPNLVNMSLAVRDDNPPARGGLTRTSGGEGIYSPSGVWGDATLGTREKGEIVVEAMVEDILDDIAGLRAADLPAADPPRR